MRLQGTEGSLQGNSPLSILGKDMRDEKFSEVASNARSDSGGRRRIKRARARARRCRGKYHELAGLSAAPSGIAAAIVTTRRATVVHLSAQVATSASLTCSVRIVLFPRGRHFSDASNSGRCRGHFPAHVYKRLNRLCHSQREGVDRRGGSPNRILRNALE